MSNKIWTNAVHQVCLEQAENGDFTDDGEMLICHQDPDETFRVIAEHLDTDTLQEWLINSDVAMQLILEAVKAPSLAENWMLRVRSALGRQILIDNAPEIEALHAQTARQYAHDAYWDARFEDARDLG